MISHVLFVRSTLCVTALVYKVSLIWIVPRDSSSRGTVHADRRVFLYLFTNRCSPTCPLTSSLNFLPLFLGISYSTRVSRQDPMRDPFTTPLHISIALAWRAHSQGSRGKREVNEKKNRLRQYDYKEHEENDGLHHTSPTHNDQNTL
jgi:hypothetical protein